MNNTRKNILLSNDDGIESPGLWAAAAALSPLGFVTIVAPNIQYSGAGRSHPLSTDGRITRKTLAIAGKDWATYSINGSPAQAVMYAIMDVLPEIPDLVVSGINYGENLGSDITISGTVGAALEGASFGIPAMAVSLQLTSGSYTSNSAEVDFTAPAFFTEFFAKKLLEKAFPAEVNILKIDVPALATPQTPWRVVPMSKQRYFTPVSNRANLEDPGRMEYYPLETDDAAKDAETDIFTVRVNQEVAVTPLSLDMTSRFPMRKLDDLLRNP
jgi:5'-nucleotidase